MSPKPKPETETSSLPAVVPTHGGVAIPDWMEASNAGKEQIDPADLSLPRLAVVNALSKPFKEGRAKLGDIVDTVSGNILFEAANPKPIKGVFMAVHRMRLRWRGKGADGAIECSSQDGRTAIQENGIHMGKPTRDCSKCEYSLFVKLPNGDTQKPACSEFREFLLLAEGYPLPLIVSLGKSAAKTGKKLVEKLNSDMGMTGRPIFAFAFEISSRQVIAKGNEYYELVIKPSGFPTREVFESAKGLYEKYAHTLRKQDISVVGGGGDDAGDVVDNGAPKI